MKTRIALAAVLFLAACSSRSAMPDPGGNPRAFVPRDSTQRELFAAYRAAQMPSVYALIGARERLKLTSRQVTALDSIAEAAREQNRPMTDSLRTLTNSGSGGPIRAPRGEFQTERFIPALRRMGENNRRALEAIQALLTPEQRTGVCELAREQREQRYAVRGRGGLGGRRDGRGRGRGGMRDGMLGIGGDDVREAGGGVGGWPWCPAPARGRNRTPAPADSSRASAGALRS
ncbi:MAG TPA: Spy/CpxP family protein refolding chaperone [Longimicrobium sp.]|nr:Spy/CpxP family protein refolding chaperone [Longimicrobium sp.]